MARKLDQILVIDVESTCWEGDPPEGQVNEIIEIGVCMLDVQKCERVIKRSILVKPERSEISDFCTKLTSLTPQMLLEGISFAEALKILKSDFQSRDRVFASWGDYDRRQFERQCAELKLGYPFGPTHLNVKTLFATAMGLEHEVGMDGAYSHVGLAMEGQHHRGVDDAWNIAGLLGKMLSGLRKNWAV